MLKEIDDVVHGSCFRGKDNVACGYERRSYQQLLELYRDECGADRNEALLVGLTLRVDSAESSRRQCSSACRRLVPERAE